MSPARTLPRADLPAAAAPGQGAGRTRAILLAAAATVLGEEGPAALTVRRIAEAVNASTKLIYTHFGGMDGLLDALYRESFARLTAAFEAHAGVAGADARLRGMTEAYRALALAEPALYRVMFGDAGRAWEPDLSSRREAWQSFRTLRGAVEACRPARATTDPVRVTYLLWAAMHGVVSLELRGLLGPAQDGAELFRAAVDAVLRTWRPIPSAAAG